PQADSERAEGHRRPLGLEEPGQGGDRGHPARLHDHGGGPRRRRQDRRLRQGQEGAPRPEEAEAAHLSEQRGTGPGPPDRGGGPLHHVEGTGGAVAERRRQHPDRRAEGRHHHLRLRLRGAEERAEPGRLLCVPRRGDGGVGPGGLRRGHGVQPRRRQREGRARSQEAHRLRPRGREALRQPGPRVPRQAHGGAEGLLGQGIQGLRADIASRTAVLATAESLGSLAAREQRGGRLSTAAILVGPATIFVTIGLLLPILLLFRYSLNAFVPGKLMVEALTAENYVLFVTDPYYLAAFTRTLRVAVIVTALCVVLAFPL